MPGAAVFVCAAIIVKCLMVALDSHWNPISLVLSFPSKEALPLPSPLVLRGVDPAGTQFSPSHEQSLRRSKVRIEYPPRSPAARPLIPYPAVLLTCTYDRESFPIAAAVAGGMVVVIFAAIIVVFSYSQSRRRRNPLKTIGDVEAGPVAQATVAPRGGLKIIVVDPDPERAKPRGVEQSPYSGSRKDGSTIYVSSPSGEAE
ncbi:hypothetical protein C8R45DRAFT_1183065 [Mycena sanguinolenta]|nr:hypothetical protein C8R45DRAFT_1183065 [Mycena sanguinolenta]